MANEFIIKNGFQSRGDSEVTGSLNLSENISGSTTSTSSFGTYLGDGSQLTGISSTPFPFTGDAQITGSLIVSGSNNKLDLTLQSAIFIGKNVGISQTVAGGGRNSIFIGEKAGFTNAIGNDNLCIGLGAGAAIGQGPGGQPSDGNIFIGKLSAAGNASLPSATAKMNEADNNIGIGFQSLLYLVSGDENIAIGSNAMRGSGAIMSAKNNIAIGQISLYKTDTGNHNIGIGYYAGLNQTSGDGNITIGSGSLGIAGESNQLRIGNGNSLVTISGSLETGEILLNTTTISGSLLNTGTVSVNNGNGSPASPYTLTGTQQFILINPSGGDVTINMPDAATYPGREIRFKLTQAAGANTVTLQRQGADTIDGATTYTDLDIQYESISTVSNGSNGWFIF